MAGLLLFASFGMTGCTIHEHVVGDGAQSAQEEEARQWYVLWGLVPLNNVDTNEMAEGAEDYTIVTETSVIDGLISIVLGFVTVQSRTVTVTK
ncbi:MAG: hypothetical protein AAF730_13475 [Bacteroidota bacterium]